jgi:hypothetical protein
LGRALSMLLLLAGSVSGAVPHQGARSQELSITFEASEDFSGGGGTMDFGRLPLRPGRHAHAVGARKIVRVWLRAVAGAAHFARLYATLDNASGGCIVRVDGIRLGPVRQLIDGRAPVGAAVSHTIDIEVPASEPPGTVLAPIAWLAETDS